MRSEIEIRAEIERLETAAHKANLKRNFDMGNEYNTRACALEWALEPSAPSSPASPTPPATALRNRLVELCKETKAATADPTKARASLIAANTARIEEVEAALRMVEGGANHFSAVTDMVESVLPAGNELVGLIAKAIFDSWAQYNEVKFSWPEICQASKETARFPQLSKMHEQATLEAHAALTIAEPIIRAKALEEAADTIGMMVENNLANLLAAFNFADSDNDKVESLLLLASATIRNLAIKDRPHD